MFNNKCFNWSAMVLTGALTMGMSATAVAGKYRISGPYTKHNLSMFLIHGKDEIKNQNFLTLSEAMRNKKVKVHETSTVNKLSIENLSENEHIYIQAGDIVKGGKQDRVFSTDMVLEPGSGKINIAAFCVERSRWSKRGKESAKVFSSSTKSLSSKKLRLAARLKKNQSEVWSEVDKAQKKLAKSVGHDVKSKKSYSSLQLTLENKKLVGKLSDYKKSLMPLLRGKKQVIGYAFAVNGKLNTADIYANQSLFKKLWPKIVESASTEAVGEFDKKVKYSAPKPAAITQWMKDSSKGKLKTSQLKKGLKQDTIENKDNVRFDTYTGTGRAKKVYRKNYMKK